MNRTLAEPPLKKCFTFNMSETNIIIITIIIVIIFKVTFHFQLTL